jgi:hypothetical protein
VAGVTSPLCSYVLPLRWSEDEGIDELAAYLRRIAQVAEVIVVDGSDPEVFARHAARLSGFVRHLAVDRARRTPMGKVGGVATGVEAASHEQVVIADDDVRYGLEALRRTAALLGDAELVRPQNYFADPGGLPWHAHWDTGRTLLNRALGRDYPGTLAVRRSFFREIGGYDGASLFENLELIRTVEAAGGRVASPLDLYVARCPPTTRHFLSQRVRQAYDEFARPPRMAVNLTVLPLAACTVASGRGRSLAAGAAAIVALAEFGRRRAQGARYFPATASLLAPAWMTERALCSWLALRHRARGGVPYAGRRLRRAATSRGELRRRFAARAATPVPG